MIERHSYINQKLDNNLKNIMIIDVLSLCFLLHFSNIVIVVFFLYFLFLLFLSTKFLRDGWRDFPDINRDGRKYKLFEAFFYFFKIYFRWSVSGLVSKIASTKHQMWQRLKQLNFMERPTCLN